MIEHFPDLSVAPGQRRDIGPVQRVVFHQRFVFEARDAEYRHLVPTRSVGSPEHPIEYRQIGTEIFVPMRLHLAVMYLVHMRADQEFIEETQAYRKMRMLQRIESEKNKNFRCDPR